MDAFYERLSGADVETLDRLARLLLELRDSRAHLLARYGADDEREILERITAGALPEHPAYEDYLGARSISSLREAIRADLKSFMQGIRLP